MGGGKDTEERGEDQDGCESCHGGDRDRTDGTGQTAGHEANVDGKAALDNIGGQRYKSVTIAALTDR